VNDQFDFLRSPSICALLQRFRTDFQTGKQIEGLLKRRNPTMKFTEAQLESAIIELLGDEGSRAEVLGVEFDE
jgi:hypothetical protein